MRFASILGRMADASDTALEPIGAVQRTRVGREATEPMRADIRLLGTILGDTVRAGWLPGVVVAVGVALAGCVVLARSPANAAAGG